MDKESLIKLVQSADPERLRAAMVVMITLTDLNGVINEDELTEIVVEHLTLAMGEGR